MYGGLIGAKVHGRLREETLKSLGLRVLGSGFRGTHLGKILPLYSTDHLAAAPKPSQT